MQPNGKISYGDVYHMKKKRNPHADVHKISSVKLKHDSSSRFVTDYRHRFDDLEVRRNENLEVMPNG